MDRYFLFFYILNIVFLIALIIGINIEPLNYILVMLVGTSINIMAIYHFEHENRKERIANMNCSFGIDLEDIKEEEKE